MRIFLYRDRCTSGHPQRHPFSRNLAICWGRRTLKLGIRYNSTGSIYLCEPCTLGYTRGEG